MSFSSPDNSSALELDPQQWRSEMMNRGPPSEGDQNRGPQLLAVIWIFTILALVVVSLKLYTRFRILREPGLDDAFTAVSVVFVTISSSLMTVGIHAGLGRHVYYLDLHQRKLAMQMNIIANPFGALAYSLPNVSVAMFLNRILNLTTGQKWFIYAVAISQNVFALASSILILKQCTPFAFLWDPTIKATCLPLASVLGYSYFIGAYSAFTDVFLAVIPIIVFWKMQMKLKTKIGVSLLMSTTFCAAICAIVKTTKLHYLKELDDFTYAGVDLLLWAVIESNIIVIAACVPSLRPFIISTTKKSPKYVHDRYTNNKALQLRDSPYVIETIGSKRMNHMSPANRSENSLAPENAIQKKTEILMEWERA